MNIICAHDRMQQKCAFTASCTVTTLPAVRNFNIVVCACSLAKGAWSCKHFTLWTFACHFWICHVPRLHRASLKAGDESVVPDESQDHSIKLVLLRHQPLPLGITFLSTAQGEFSFFFCTLQFIKINSFLSSTCDIRQEFYSKSWSYSKCLKYE